MKLFKNLKFQLLVGLFLFLFTIFYGFGYFLIDAFKQSYNQSIEDSLTTVTKDLRHEFNTYLNNASEFEYIKHEFDVDILYGQIVVFDKHKTAKIVLKSNDLKSSSLDFNNINIENLKPHEIIFTDENIQLLTTKKIKVATTLIELKDGSRTVLQCGIPYNKHTPFLQNLKLLLWIGLLSLLGIILVAVYFIISKSLIATKVVVDEVKNIKLDGKAHSIPQTGIAKEIDELISTFNKLIDDLQNNYNKVKDFGQNASHELKTPLTIIRGEIEVGLRKDRTSKEYKEILSSTLGELNYLEDTIEKILFLSSNSDSYIVEHFEEIYIDEILDESIKEKKAFANQKNIDLVVLDLEPITKYGNQTLLKIAINNILENAIKYSNENSKINISLTKNSLLVEDFGCGIPKEDIEKIFDRFYRVDKTRSKRDGSGLGLSIVKTIFDLHSFTINIKSVEDEFTKVMVEF